MPTESKHTPETWQYVESNTMPGHFWIGLSKDSIGVSGYPENRQDSDERYMAVHGICTEADARLMTASPDLLAALITALPYIETAEMDEGYKKGAVAKVTREVLTAIAKATGK